MIVGMKKISMVVQTKDKTSTLDSLGDLGLVHLQDFHASSPQVESAMAKRNEAGIALAFLADFKGKEEVLPPSLEPPEAVKEILEIREDFLGAKERVANLEKKISELREWGDFDPADFGFLADKGYYLKIYTVTSDKIDKMDGIEGDVVILRKDKKGLVFGHITNEPVLLEDFEEFVIPSQSLSAMKAEKEGLHAKIEEIIAKAEKHYGLRPILQSYLKTLEANIKYWTASANAMDEDNLTAIIGFLPDDGVEALQSWAAQNSVAIAVTDPDPEETDSIPTLVRNPKWIQIIEPVFQFLGIVPGYKELDISLVFLSFFILFFAMIIGDAAYGIIIFLGGLGLVFFSRSKKRTPPLAAWTFTILGLATIVWGTINGSWFTSAELIKGTFLERLIIPQLAEGFSIYTPSGELYKQLNSYDVVMLFSFIIGLLHLTIAQVWNFLQALARRSLQAVGEVGWMCINFGLFYLVLDMVINFNLDQVLGAGGRITSISINLIFIGFALVILFGFQGTRFFKGLLAGLAEIPGTALGVLGAFGDIISYVRLFAVGLAGYEIGNAFNGMASGLLSGKTFIFGVLILLVGHAFNFVLCFLGVLVHGIRLKTLEFSGRLGMQWSGHEYSPFNVRSDISYVADMPAETREVGTSGAVTETI
jgi:V/A-type H+-transporting ATPase subunit I